ncbi:MAG: helix-turn-helix domain-containing protein [Saprospiraceae bacterium]
MELQRSTDRTFIVMYKNIPTGIKKIELDTSLHKLHKKGEAKDDFGMDNSVELLDSGFGLYSTANLKGSIEPIKSEYFRISLIRNGEADFNIGLERHQPKRNSIVFGFPGQIFSLDKPSKDFLALYMLFSEKFISDIFFQKKTREQFPFLTYTGLQCFELNDTTAIEIESIIFKMNDELKAKKANCSEAIRLYIQLILIHANRDYVTMLLSKQGKNTSGQKLFNSFVKSVSEHFLIVRKVADYANMLHVSPDYLNRIIKLNADKTANELIDEMLVMEAKAYLLHTKLSVSEIAYKLEFTDPSHFNKFFKKISKCTPLEFRIQSE